MPATGPRAGPESAENLFDFPDEDVEMNSAPRSLNHSAAMKVGLISYKTDYVTDFD
jgi:hypothetical protein